MTFWTDKEFEPKFTDRFKVEFRFNHLKKQVGKEEFIIEGEKFEEYCEKWTERLDEFYK